MSHQLWSPLIRYRVTPNEIYFLDCCSSKIKADLVEQELCYASCIAKGLIDSKSELTAQGTKILNEFETYLVKRKKKITEAVLGPDFLEKVKEYREAWPSKRLPSGELARQSVNELKDKMVWFFKTYPEYDWDLVLDATDYYNILFEKQQYKYMVTSSYFIKKTDPISKETRSKLADFCQEILDNPDILKQT
jgi:hypothetical protein